MLILDRNLRLILSPFWNAFEKDGLDYSVGNANDYLHSSILKKKNRAMFRSHFAPVNRHEPCKRSKHHTTQCLRTMNNNIPRSSPVCDNLEDDLFNILCNCITSPGSDYSSSKNSFFNCSDLDLSSKSGYLPTFQFGSDQMLPALSKGDKKVHFESPPQLPFLTSSKSDSFSDGVLSLSPIDDFDVNKQEDLIAWLAEDCQKRYSFMFEGENFISSKFTSSKAPVLTPRPVKTRKHEATPHPTKKRMNTFELESNPAAASASTSPTSKVIGSLSIPKNTPVSGLCLSSEARKTKSNIPAIVKTASETPVSQLTNPTPTTTRGKPPRAARSDPPRRANLASTYSWYDTFSPVECKSLSRLHSDKTTATEERKRGRQSPRVYETSFLGENDRYSALPISPFPKRAKLGRETDLQSVRRSPRLAEIKWTANVSPRFSRENRDANSSESHLPQRGKSRWEAEQKIFRRSPRLLGNLDVENQMNEASGKDSTFRRHGPGCKEIGKL